MVCLMSCGPRRIASPAIGERNPTPEDLTRDRRLMTRAGEIRGCSTHFANMVGKPRPSPGTHRIWRGNQAIPGHLGPLRVVAMAGKTFGGAKIGDVNARRRSQAAFTKKV